MAPSPSGARGDRIPGGAEERNPSVPETEETAIDAVPEAVRDAARRAFDARVSGVPVADLVFDSLIDSDFDGDPDDDPDKLGELRAFPARSDTVSEAHVPTEADAVSAPVRRLRFCVPRTGTELPDPTAATESADEAVLVTAQPVGSRLRLTIQLRPPAIASVEVRGSAQSVRTETDQQGHAEIDVSPGMTSLLICPLPDGSPSLQTAWVRL